MSTKIISGDAPRLYQAIRSQLQPLFWTDSRNADTCAWMVAACIHTQQCSLAVWAAQRSSAAQRAQSRERQITRWLSNPRVDPLSIYGPLVLRALRHWGKHRLVLALDTSMLFNRFCLVQIAVLYRGRAVPLYFEVLEHNSAQLSCAQLKSILAKVYGMLSFAGIHDVRLLADRGFCDTELMDWLRAMGWHFRIRIKSNLILSTPSGQRWCKPREVDLAPRETRFFQGVHLTAKRFGPVHVAMARPSDGPERWQVVSDEPVGIEVFEEYGERFQIEEGFLDHKSGLFELEGSQVRDAAILQRIVLIVALATLLLVSEGTEVVDQGRRREVDPHWRRGLSYLKIGLRAVQHALVRGQRLLMRLMLRGGPDPEPLGFRKSKKPNPVQQLKVGWMMACRPLS